MTGRLLHAIGLFFIITLVAHTLITHSVGANSPVSQHLTYGSVGGKISIAVTAAPLAFVASFIGGDRVAVNLLIPAGVDPHHFEPSTTFLVSSLSNVSIVLMTGPSHLIIESRIDELARGGIVKAYIIDYRDYVRHGLTLLANPRTGKVNPHGYLFTYSGLLAAASALAEVLEEIDPEHKDYYLSRLQEFESMLLKDNQTVRELLPGSIRVALFTPILQYVISELGLRCTEVLLQEPEAELSESALKELISAYSSGKFDVLLLTDFMATKYSKVLELLKSNGIPYIVVPISSLENTPHLIPVVVAGALNSFKDSLLNRGCSAASTGVGDFDMSEIPATIAISEAILIAILAAIVALQRKFIESKVVGSG
ncbi:MAG: zinc ABC transporter substrate-binding protein [Desulfurococcales archaeon]|nr:zinc ABC transporter substrate-binding protein [Desulfurococcales archaeon]